MPRGKRRGRHVSVDDEQQGIGCDSNPEDDQEDSAKLVVEPEVDGGVSTAAAHEDAVHIKDRHSKDWTDRCKPTDQPVSAADDHEDAEVNQANSDSSEEHSALDLAAFGSKRRAESSTDDDDDNDDDAEATKHVLDDGVQDDTQCSKGAKGNHSKAFARGRRRGAQKSTKQISSGDEDARAQGDTGPTLSKTTKSKERRKGRQQRDARRADVIDDDPADDRANSASQGNRRKRQQTGRRGHDAGHASDRETADHPPDDSRQSVRVRDSHATKHSVEKLGREPNSTTFVSFKTFHGKHLAALPNGELRGKSHVIGDPEKFELIRHLDDTISLKTCHGTHVAVDRNGDLQASRTTVGDQEKFELIQHAAGAVDKHTFIGAGYMCVSLKSCFGLYVAADPKGGVKANRRAVSGWESFHLKARVQAMRCKVAEDAVTESACAGADLPIFDACCDLEAVLNAEENYSKSHNDHVALAFAKRARARRAQGLEHSFSHFREEHSYPASFSGCVATWDATVVIPDGMHVPEEQSVGRERSDSELEARQAWVEILAERAGDTNTACVHAAFGIPAASAAEADKAAWERLRQLARLPQCVAVGPVCIDLSDPPAGGTLKEEHRGLTASEITAVFGTPPSKFWESPKAVYDAQRDPVCLSMAAAGVAQAAWIAKHGDRRLSEFEGACEDYARRRLDAQLKVAEDQVKLACELGRTLIVQLPPQDEAERRMAEILVSALGQGSPHPVLLSSFRGRPKCAAALLKHLPGLMIGFSGLLTHSKMRECLGEVAFDTPLERAVLESLGPRYPPAVPGIGDARGSFSHPAHVRIVGEELARVKGLKVSEVFTAVWTNTTRLFGITGEAKNSAELGGQASAERTTGTGQAEDEHELQAEVQGDAQGQIQGQAEVEVEVGMKLEAEAQAKRKKPAKKKTIN